MSGQNNHQYGLKGSKNASWKSDSRVSRYGYILIRKLDHPFHDKAGFVLEHRLVAEKYLLNDENSVVVNGKHYLSPDYVVHHINFDRADNRPENLLVLTKKAHQQLHQSLNPHRIDSKTGRYVKEEKKEVKFKKTTQSAIIPTKATPGSAGYDLCVDTEEDVVIQPGETKVFSTGISIEIAQGYAGFIFARSGISTKRGLRPATCVSVIDPDFRGAVGLPIYNDSSEAQSIKAHERVAQIVIVKAFDGELEQVDKLDDTERGANGFGSTGI